MLWPSVLEDDTEHPNSQSVGVLWLYRKIINTVEPIYLFIFWKKNWLHTSWQMRLKELEEESSH
jgi:hypothetical protein